MDRLWSPWRLAYVTASHTATDCIFGDVLEHADAELVLLRGRHAFVILNLYPYNNGHLMVAPNRHINTLVGLSSDEQTELMRLLPHDANTELVLRGLFSLFSPNLIENPRDLRLTNMALFGGFVDDNSDPFGFIAPGIGIYGGGPLDFKGTSVLPPGLSTVLASIPSVPTLLTPDRQVVPAKPNGPLYHWCNYNQLGRARGCPASPRSSSTAATTRPPSRPWSPPRGRSVPGGRRWCSSRRWPTRT